MWDLFSSDGPTNAIHPNWPHLPGSAIWFLQSIYLAKSPQIPWRSFLLDLTIFFLLIFVIPTLSQENMLLTFSLYFNEISHSRSRTSATLQTSFLYMKLCHIFFFSINPLSEYSWRRETRWCCFSARNQYRN